MLVMNSEMANERIPFKSMLWPRVSLTLLLFQGASGSRTPNNLDTRGTKRASQIIPRETENTTTRISRTNMHGILAPIYSFGPTFAN